MAKKRIVIFYSWQSDLSNSTNRGLIEKALEKAIDSLKSDADAVLEPCMTRDTLEVPGTPDIPATIFEKIDQCHIFVGDVSIINSAAVEGRKTPNPNVLLELGYAAKKLGWDNVICVYNTAFGPISDLPFDLQRRRMCRYSATKEQEQKAPQRDQLAAMLREALGTILKQWERAAQTESAATVMTPEKAATAVHEWLVEERFRIRLDRLIADEGNKLVERAGDAEFPVQVASQITQDFMKQRVQRYEEICAVPLAIMAAGCYYGSQSHEKLWINLLQKALNTSTKMVSGNTALINMRRYPAALLLYTGGIASVAKENYSMFLALLNKPKAHEYDRKLHTISERLHPAYVISSDHFNWMLGDNTRYYTPLNDHMFAVLREPLKPYLHDDESYQVAFDTFEYMRALSDADGPETYPVIGRFGWQWRSLLRNVAEEIDAEVRAQGQQWAPFQAGWFGGKMERYLAAQKKVREAASGLPWH
jgi:hypothetical protein